MVYVLFADGFEEVEALYPIDILMRGGLNVRKISVTGDRTVVGTHGIAVVTDALLDGIGDDIELLMLPGGMPGAATLDALPEMDALIEKTLKGGGRVSAICAAPMVLGKRGYLDGKAAVCYPGFEKFLAGAELASERVVTDGMITTAVGMGAAGELGLVLLSLLRGSEAAERVSEAAFIGESDLYETETLTPPEAEEALYTVEPHLWDAVTLLYENGKLGMSLLQRKLSIGYCRAAKIVDCLEQLSIIGENEDLKAYTPLVCREEAEKRIREFEREEL